jgi:hypothetical protein
LTWPSAARFSQGDQPPGANQRVAGVHLVHGGLPGGSVHELTSKWLKRGTHRSVGELTASIQSWIDTWNDAPRPFVWTKTADQILDNITRYLQRISNSEH